MTNPYADPAFVQAVHDEVVNLCFITFALKGDDGGITESEMAAMMFATSGVTEEQKTVLREQISLALLEGYIVEADGGYRLSRKMLEERQCTTHSSK